MRIFTTLLVLLLASPSVFAETYVCSYLRSGSSSVESKLLKKTANGFEERFGRNSRITWENVYEDDLILVLHNSLTMTYQYAPLRYSSEIFQIQKCDDCSVGEVLFTWGIFRSYGNEIVEGTCTVVE